MSTNLFVKFPKITYDKKTLANILKRVKIKNTVLNDASAYYPYIIEPGETVDHVAYNYYGDSNLAWLVLLANDIADPYFDWYLTVPQFERFIKSKYNSIAEAQSTIIHYKNNTDGHIVTPETIEFSSLSGITPSDYSAVDAYTFEDEKNETKKFIKLLDAALVTRVVNEMRVLLNE